MEDELEIAILKDVIPVKLLVSKVPDLARFDQEIINL